MIEKYKGHTLPTVLTFLLTTFSAGFSGYFCIKIGFILILQDMTPQELFWDYSDMDPSLHSYIQALTNKSVVPSLVFLIITVLLALFSFLCLMTLSGYRKTQNGVQKVRFGVEWIPLDFLFVVIGTMDLTLLLIMSELTNTLFDYWDFTIAIGILLYLVFIIINLRYCMAIASNVKHEAWWRRTLCYFCLSLCYKGCILLINTLGNIWKNLRQTPRLFGLFFAVSFLELIILVWTLDWDYYDTLLFLWFVEKLVLFSLFILVLRQYRAIQDTTKDLAKGNLDCTVDTTHMLPFLKEEGDALNEIQSGLQRAVQDRMKSEHFQTELITNVSHDLKTPLTSIISYVDLLGKENLENETAKEYIQVLSRQSLRLKKLLQDLLDASKASTGTIPLQMEPVDAGVLLNQTVGEFQEKLAKNDISLKIKTTETPEKILADPRYLWRVFDNLMQNIERYGQPNTRAYINLKKVGETIEISFLNTSKEELNISTEELMQRFVRGDSSRNTEGSGLGLSIAQSLTKQMNGVLQLSIDGDLFKVALTFPKA